MQNKILRGTIALENGTEAIFFLNSSEVELLEREAEEMREFYQDLETRTNIAFPGYSIMDELVCAAIEPYLKELKKEAAAYSVDDKFNNRRFEDWDC